MKTALTLFHIRRIIMGEADKKAMEKKIKDAEKAEKQAQKKKLKEDMKKQKVSFFTDFKKFITKGNVLDMAVGVVVGSAFSAIVNGLVKMIINPCIALIPGAESMDSWKTVLQAADEAAGTAEVAILWGEWIQTIINFFIIAFSIFVVVRVIRSMERKLNAKEIKKQEEAAAKKKAEEDAKAAAAKAAADEKAAAEKAIIDEYYANIREQSQLLREIKEALKK